MAKIKAICHGCGAIAHGKIYSMHQKGDGIGERTGNKFLCILCASSLVGNAMDYPDQYDRPATIRETFAHMNYLANIQMDRMEKLAIAIATFPGGKQP